MTTRVDWFRFTVYTALFAGLCAIFNVAGWLVQQVAIVAWPVVYPIIKAHSDTLLAALLLACVVAGVVAVAREDGR